MHTARTNIFALTVSLSGWHRHVDYTFPTHSANLLDVTISSVGLPGRNSMRMRILFIMALVGSLVTLAHALPRAVLEELAGTYQTTVTQADIEAQEFYLPVDLVGTWTITLREDGDIIWHYESATNARTYEMRGVWLVHGDRIYVGHETGPHPCNIASGVYTWTWADDALVLTASEDPCIQRRIIATAH